MICLLTADSSLITEDTCVNQTNIYDINLHVLRTDWTEANIICQRDGGRLLRPDNEKDMQFISILSREGTIHVRYVLIYIAEYKSLYEPIIEKCRIIRPDKF